MPYPHPPRQQSCHGGCYPAPLHAVRVRQGSCRRRRHAPCLAAPVVPLRFPPLATGLLMPRACPRRLGRHAACQALRSSRQSQAPPLCRCRAVGLRDGQACPPATAGGFALLLPPRPPERRARQGAALGRAAYARPAGAGLRFPPPAGPPSAGVRAERAGRSAAARRRRVRPSSSLSFPGSLSLAPHHHAFGQIPELPAVGGPVGRRLPAAPACEAGSESQSGRARLLFPPVPHVCRREVGCGPDTP